MYPRALPQRKHRFTFRVENFGIRFDRAMVDFFAISTNVISSMETPSYGTYIPLLFYPMNSLQ